MKVTTAPSGSASEFVSERWTSDNAAGTIRYLRKQVLAAKAVFPELFDYNIFPTCAPKKPAPE